MDMHHKIAAQIASGMNHISVVERNKDKEKSKKSKKDVQSPDAPTATSAHMNLLDRYRDFHNTGSNLLEFRNLVIEGVPENSPSDVLTAQKECSKAFDALDAALRNARSCYSSLMACLAKY